ncbi:MAG: toll/interleukin-1 receptor domain-containing protein [Pseudomonadota bacterium]
MAKLFISYRRDDSKHAVDRIYELLRDQHRIPAADIFIDIDSIPLGTKFAERISEKVHECETVLVVIGPRWLDEITKRSKDTNDFVRIEIEAAINSGARIVPVLLDGTAMPKPIDLPSSISSLSEYNGITLQRESFKGDVDRLATGLEEQTLSSHNISPVAQDTLVGSFQPHSEPVTPYAEAGAIDKRHWDYKGFPESEPQRSRIAFDAFRSIYRGAWRKLGSSRKLISAPFIWILNNQIKVMLVYVPLLVGAVLVWPLHLDGRPWIIPYILGSATYSLFLSTIFLWRDHKIFSVMVGITCVSFWFFVVPIIDDATHGFDFTKTVTSWFAGIAK